MLFVDDALGAAVAVLNPDAVPFKAEPDGLEVRIWDTLTLPDADLVTDTVEDIEDVPDKEGEALLAGVFEKNADTETDGRSVNVSNGEDVDKIVRVNDERVKDVLLGKLENEG